MSRPAARARALPFVAAIALSSFALFCLELVAGQLVQPVFGGAPAVWATTLCFFTAVLFLGYLYGHAVVTRLPVRLGVALHLGVAVVAVLAVVAAPSRLGGLRIAGLADAPNVLLALTVIAGAPAFLFATTTPLISAWYARARSTGAGGAGGPAGRGPAAAGDAGHDRDAFWLYAASNGASFVAVLGYPFLVQPFLALSVQRSLIAVMAVVFTGLLIVITVRLRGLTGPAATPTSAASIASAASAASAASTASEASDTSVTSATSGQVTWRRRGRWLAAAFVPAGLLSATTMYITTDLVSAPLLWVWPLAIYLASFVVAFSDRGRRMLPRIERLVPAAATLLWVPSLVFGSWPVLPLLLVELTSFGVLASAIHGRLAADRPAERHLTGFYLVLSAGGVLATAFVALVAPLVFQDVYEYPLLIVAALAVLALYRSPLEATVWSPLRPVTGAVLAAGRRLLPYAVLGVIFFVLIIAQRNQLPAVALRGIL